MTKWTKTADELPPPYELVLGCWISQPPETYWVCRRKAGAWHLAGMNFSTQKEPDYWMPISPPFEKD